MYRFNFTKVVEQKLQLGKQFSINKCIETLYTVYYTVPLKKYIYYIRPRFKSTKLSFRM
jgi:hypothetical protein